MKIAISSELTKLRTMLNNNGYYVYDIKDTEPCDIYICSGVKNQLLNITGSVNEGGALIIYAMGKTYEDILYEIENRRYSSLF